MISEPCAECGALWGSLCWKRGGSGVLSDQQRACLLNAEILALLIGTRNKSQDKVPAGPLP